MNHVPDEAVIAYVDGCMDGEARTVFEVRLANDPVLRERVAAHRWMARQIAAAYGQPLETAVDASLISRLGLDDDNVIAISDYRRPTAQRGMIWAARIGALAASLVVGIVIGQEMLTPDSALVADTGGRLMAHGALAAGLSNQLAGAAGPVRIGISFRTENGICRTFRTAQGISGLGCREGAHWLVPTVVTENTAQMAPTEYRQASGDVAPLVMAEVDRRIKGEPLTTSEEAQLKATGWR